MENKITSGTIARTIILAVALLNQVLVMRGVQTIAIADETINLFVANGATIIAAIMTWWKNNSFSKAALVGDTVKEAEKAKAP